MSWWPFAHNDKNVHNTVKVPIVFVPGVMGTKLSLSPMDWDPDKFFGLYFWWKWGHASQNQKMAACGNRQGEPDVVMDANKNNGFGSVAASFYKDFLNDLKNHPFNPAITPVYAVGYDWRLSLSDAASYLKGRILQILSDENAKRAVIITHSMGGLVSRTMFKQHPETQSSIAGAIHVVQPVAGAVVLYRRFFTGMQDALDGSDLASKVLNSALGRAPGDFAMLMSILPGPMQLCPTGYYQRGSGWLNIHRDGFPAVLPQDQSIYDAYANAISPPGIYNESLDNSETTKSGLQNLIGEAKELHGWLQTSMLEGKTKAIYATGLNTDVAISFLQPPQAVNLGVAQSTTPSVTVPGPFFADGLSVVPDQESEGDGTVPQNSANVLFPGEAYDLSDDINDPDNHQFAVPNVAHADAFTSKASGTVWPGVYQLVQQAINQAIADLAK